MTSLYSERELIPTIYISGPMTGYPDFNYPAFYKAEHALRGAGYTVVNPAAFGGAHQTGLDYSGLLKRDIRLLLECTGIAMLDGWLESVGAKTEHQVAHACGIEIRALEDWL